MNAPELASRLLAVRDGAPPIEHMPPELQPRDVADAYAVAGLIVAALESRYGRVRGYKVGATSLPGQRMLSLSEPFYGRTFAPCILADGETWHLGGRPCTVEAEIGFVMQNDLPPRMEEYSMSTLRAAIGMVVPLLEINRPAYARPFEVGGLCLIADNGVTQGFVVGAPGLQLEAADPSGEVVNMSRSGVLVASGSGKAVLGHPLNAVLWLANALRVRGEGLRAGDVIASGAMAAHVPLAVGDLIDARYSTLGAVRIQVED